MSKRVLVTGCGGDIGQSICKILIEENYTIFGVDISDRNAARFIVKDFSIAPKCTDINYISYLKDFIEDNAIEIVIPTSEPELRFITQNKEFFNYFKKIKFVLANFESREIGFDKLFTSKFLKDHNLPFPKNYYLDDSNIPFPLIGKSKTGSGSANIEIIKNYTDFDYVHSKYENFVYQEFLDGTEGEFTCGLFRSSKGMIRSLIFKRELHGGFSGYGKIVESKIIEDLLINLAEKLNLHGSINVQLRLHKGKPTVFEINPRFSSTVLFRHLFGFKDLLWSIEDIQNENISDYIKPEEGREFFKGFNEFVN